MDRRYRPAAGLARLFRLAFDVGRVQKLRGVGRGNWILCQITSNLYGDVQAILLEDMSFVVGALRIASYACPGKLFTANRTLMVTEVGRLAAGSLR